MIINAATSPFPTPPPPTTPPIIWNHKEPSSPKSYQTALEAHARLDSVHQSGNVLVWPLHVTAEPACRVNYAGSSHSSAGPILAMEALGPLKIQLWWAQSYHGQPTHPVYWLQSHRGQTAWPSLAAPVPPQPDQAQHHHAAPDSHAPGPSMQPLAPKSPAPQ